MTDPGANPLPRNSAGDVSRRRRRLTAQISIVSVVITGLVGAVFYNEFFGLQVSSRLPYFAALPIIIILAILPFAGRLGGKNLLQFLTPGTAIFYFIAVVVAQAVNFDGSADASLSILNSVTLVALAIIFQQCGLRQTCKALIIFITLYLLIMYPLSALSGDIGLTGSEQGSFVGGIAPFLNRLIVNEAFLSGRGVIGIFGVILTCWALARAEAISAIVLVTCLVAGFCFTIVSDSRAPIVILVLLAVVRLVFLKKRLYRAILLMGSFVSFILSSIQAFYINLIAFVALLSFLSRKGMDTQQLGRVVIVDVARQTVFSSPQAMVFGHGTAGAESSLKNNLQAIQYPEIITSAHNFILQTMLDGGLLLYSALCLIYIQLYRKRALIRSDNPDHMFALSVFMILNVYGLSASITGFVRLTEQAILMVLSFTAISIICNEKASVHAPARPRRRPKLTARLISRKASAAHP